MHAQCVPQSPFATFLAMSTASNTRFQAGTVACKRHTASTYRPLLQSILSFSLTLLYHLFEESLTNQHRRWPVIVAIVIGSLIVLSVLFCVARCLCCGAECACCCFRCCTDCCRSSGRSSRRNNAYSPAPQPVYQQPQPYSAPYSSAAPPTYSTKPQFARFDASRKGPGGGDQDSLPAMPSWDAATSHKVEVEEEEPEDDGTELQHLDPHNNKPGSPSYPAAAATMRSNQPTPAQAYGGAGAIPGYAHPNSSSDLAANNYSASNLSQRQNPYATNPPYHNPQGPYSPPRSPPQRQDYGYAHSSAGYTPSGTTEYEQSSSPTAYAPKQYQAYGGGGAGGTERKPVQGSWKDV